jgi:hypothetical protein
MAVRFSTIHRWDFFASVVNPHLKYRFSGALKLFRDLFCDVPHLISKANAAIKPRAESSMLELCRGAAVKGRQRRANAAIEPRAIKLV